MKCIRLVAMLIAGMSIASNRISAAELFTVDLTRWRAPDISTAGADPFGQLIKYGYALFSNTANEIGPAVPDLAKRFAGNNLTCQNCHLQAGTQPYAMPMTGVWGQFPQYRGREGGVATLEGAHQRLHGAQHKRPSAAA